MMNCHYLSFLIDEIWLDLQNIIFYFPYLWETSYIRSLGQAGWSLILGWHQKACMLSVKRPECFNGHVSPLGFSERA